jgi:hypothetical protein
VRAALAAADELVARDPATARGHLERWLGSRQELTHT